MQKKLWLLLAGYLVLYTGIRIAYHLPELIHGLSRFAGERGSTLSLLQRLPEMAISFCFTLLPYILLVWLYPKKRFGFLFIGIILAACTIFLTSYWYNLAITPYHIRLKSFFIHSLFFQSAYLLYGVLFYFIRYAHFSELHQKEIVLKNRESELAFLRAQINPHFLFNQLNTIYSLVYQQDAQALPALAGLSDMLRYMLYDTTEQVALEKEVVYLEKYIELQQLRLGQAVKVDFQVTGDTHAIPISPLLFLPFVENAFKHGDPGGDTNVRINAEDSQVHFYCENRKGKRLVDAAGGIGIENVKKRLVLLYPGKHHLAITEDAGKFTVNLDITLS